ncbi:nicotinate-nucleotide adenylyltransferase [Ferrimonas pelagia]|uniref:Probable nicotinate-nucleotide adenylyltransferase n=1 Tax=Ferrimonas pelagia TaxID=1177826 RepID=A0ABP9F1G5_9GAMM
MSLLGLFGGTFDPIHNGHLRCAYEVQQALALDEIALLPNRLPPHKASPGVSAEQRLAMAQLAVADLPGLRVDPRELQRQTLSYTVDTLEELKAEQPERTLCFIVGMDSLLSFHRWHRPERILQLAHLVVCHRPGYALDVDSEAQHWLEQHRLSAPAQLRQQACGGIYLQPTTLLDIASSTIRAQLNQGQLPHFLLPPQVVAYIEQHQLYPRGDGGAGHKPL